MDDTEKQSIKESRVRSYFIAATRDIIMQKGVESVTVRKVADLAGYSYATIYNYFNDSNALLMETKRLMVRDMVSYLNSMQGGKVKSVDEIKQLNRMYAGYYLEHPYVFQFFYAYRQAGEPKTGPQYFEYAASWHDTYQIFVANGTIREADVDLVAKTIIYALHGLLALFFSDNGLTQEALFNDLDQLTEYLLKRRDES